MIRERSCIRQIDRDLAFVGGSLAWVSPWGLGVDLSEKPITAVQLRNMPYTLHRLVWLTAAYSMLDDAGLRVLAKARGLESLDLEGARVTAHGLLALTRLRRLVEIRVGDTAVTASDEPALRQAGLRAVIHRHRFGPRCRWRLGITQPVSREAVAT